MGAQSGDMTDSPEEPTAGQQPYEQPAPPPYGQPTPPPYPPGGYPVGPYGVSPQAPYGVDPRTGLPCSDRSKLVAGLLQLFLGGFGIGRFYLGDTKIGVWQIVVTV